MNDSRNMAICILTISAAILGALAVGVFIAQEPAYAAVASQGGDYAIVTGAYSAELDVVYVLNIAEERLNAYVLDGKTMKLVDKANLKRLFGGR